MLPKNIKLIIDFTIGDGWIGYRRPTDKKAQYICCHSFVQADYCKYKEQKLIEAGYGITGIDRVVDNTKSKNFGKRYYTIYAKSHIDFSTAHKHLYNKKVKTIDKHLLRDLDAESLAFWFMDDGCAKTVQYNQKETIRYYYETRKVNGYKLSTNCFSLDENILITSWLKEKFDIMSKVSFADNSYHINIYQIESKDKLKSLLLPYVEQIPCMMYKLSYPHTFANIPYTIVPRVNNLARVETERNDSSILEDDATVQE